MSYTPTEWTSGDVITAEKLNKIESGIESASSGGSGKNYSLIQINGQGSALTQTITSKSTAAFNFMPQTPIEKSKIMSMWFRIDSGKTFIPAFGMMNGAPGMFAQMSVLVFNPTSESISITAGGDNADFVLEVFVEE